MTVNPIRQSWMITRLILQGMANTAAYIYKKLKEDHLLTKAFNWDQERGTQDFDIVCVGHSLGAGTATILAIMLKQEFPSTKCFAYSPPGGLLRLVDLDIYGLLPTRPLYTLCKLELLAHQQKQICLRNLVACRRNGERNLWLSFL